MVDLLDLPDRTAKPRQEGVTHVLDRGLSLTGVDGMVGGQYLDVAGVGEDALAEADAVMALRIQLERFGDESAISLRDYTSAWGLDEDRMRLARPGAPLLHPGPTNEGVEITAQLAASERSLIGTQVANGVPVRMAILSLLAP